MVHLVDGGLAVLHHVDVAKARRAVLLHKQRVEHEGILPVVVEAPASQGRVVLAGVEHHPVAELTVVQHHAAIFIRAFIIPVHHDALGAGVLPGIVDVTGHVQHAGGAAFQLRVLRTQPGGVLQAQAEKVRRRLDVLHTRLPVEHQQVDTAHRNVADATPCRRVPEDAGDPGALFELAPPAVAVHLLVVSLLQHHRQNAGKRPRRLLVVGRPGQHVGFRVVVHGVGVLVGDAVEQPPAGRLGLARHHGVLVIFPVPHAEPQLVIDQALVQCRLSGLVALQSLHRLGHLCFAHRQSFVLVFVHRVSPFHLYKLAPSGALPERFKFGKILPACASPAGRRAWAVPHSAPAG